MRPIDYAIKLIVAYNMDKDYFLNLARNLYFEDFQFYVGVKDCLEENDMHVANVVEDVFNEMSLQM